MSYGASLADLYRRAAEYVVDILKGAKPGDLPVKLASKFEIFINLKTCPANWPGGTAAPSGPSR